MIYENQFIPKYQLKTLHIRLKKNCVAPVGPAMLALLLSLALTALTDHAQIYPRAPDNTTDQS
jgi:hypothetical protein